MRQDEPLVQDTLFLACTRPAMVAGVPIEAAGVSVISAGLMCGVVLHNFLAAPVIYIAAHLVCRQIVRHNPNAFKVLFCWFDTKLRHRTNGFWGGASVSPLPLLRRYSIKELRLG